MSCQHSYFRTKPTFSCRFHFRRRSRHAAGDNRSLQVCFRLGAKKIRSAPCICTGYGSRLAARTGVSRDALLVAVAGAWGRTEPQVLTTELDPEPLNIFATYLHSICFNVILTELLSTELTCLTRTQEVLDSKPAEDQLLWLSFSRYYSGSPGHFWDWLRVTRFSLEMKWIN
jgi:hypothetical protein